MKQINLTITKGDPNLPLRVALINIIKTGPRIPPN